MADPCNLPLAALEAGETCPRCGCLARQHPRHRAFEPVIEIDTSSPAVTVTFPQPKGRDEEIDALLTQLAESRLETGAARAALAEVERERDEDAKATRGMGAREWIAADPHHVVAVWLKAAMDRAERAERERDEARADNARLREAMSQARESVFYVNARGGLGHRNHEVLSEALARLDATTTGGE